MASVAIQAIPAIISALPSIISLFKGGKISPQKMRQYLSLSHRGYEGGFKFTAPQLTALKQGMSLLGAGKKRTRKSSTGAKKRGAIVARVMRDQGLSLPQASRFVKMHGLY